MKFIIAGGRDFGHRYREDGTFDESWAAQCRNQMSHACKRILMLKQAPSIVSGTARGADTLGEEYGESAGLLVHKRPADWDSYGKVAGFIRNKEMAEEADGLIAFWDGKSKGTKHMIDVALDKGIEVHVFRYEPSVP